MAGIDDELMALGLSVPLGAVKMFHSKRGLDEGQEIMPWFKAGIAKRPSNRLTVNYWQTSVVID